jgi:hypothetical protein
VSTLTGPLGFWPTSGNQGWLPVAERQWDEIIPGLWLGGQACQPAGGTCQPGSTFDTVYSMTYVEQGLHPDAAVLHRCYEMPDIERLKCHHRALLHGLADDVLADLAAHRKVLVRCWAGYNRSALLVALVLVRLGYPPSAAIDLMRTRRSRYVLSNHTFEAWLLSQGGATDG